VGFCHAPYSHFKSCSDLKCLTEPVICITARLGKFGHQAFAIADRSVRIQHSAMPFWNLKATEAVFGNFLNRSVCMVLFAVHYLQPQSGHALFHRRITVSVTEVSVLQARMCGTACHRTYDMT